MKRTLLAVALASAAMISADRPANCGEPTCGCCGCCMKPVCRIVCEMKEVKETCYSCKCEDFCVPGKSECVGYHPECDCCGCVKMKPTYKPCWCDIFCRKKLYKKEIVKKVPHYKCVVEYVCCHGCGGGCGHHGHCHAQANGQELAPVAATAMPADQAEISAPTATPAAAYEDVDAPTRPRLQPVVARVATRLLPPPPLPDVDEGEPAKGDSRSTLRLKLK